MFQKFFTERDGNGAQYTQRTVCSPARETIHAPSRRGRLLHERRSRTLGVRMLLNDLCVLAMVKILSSRLAHKYTTRK
jgi:hypothetical protein